MFMVCAYCLHADTHCLTVQSRDFAGGHIPAFLRLQTSFACWCRYGWQRLWHQHWLLVHKVRENLGHQHRRSIAGQHLRHQNCSIQPVSFAAEPSVHKQNKQMDGLQHTTSEFCRIAICAQANPMDQQQVQVGGLLQLRHASAYYVATTMQLLATGHVMQVKEGTLRA